MITRLLIATWIVLMTMTAAPSVRALATDVVEEWVFDTYNLDTTAYEIEFVSERLTEQQSEVTIKEIKPLSQKEPLGLFTVLVVAHTQETGEFNTQVRMRVKKFADVLVASDRIGRHDVITDDCSRVERRDITTLKDMPLTDPAMAEGQRASKLIRKGTILTSRNIESIPDIEAGHEVAIVYESGLCTISAQGKALQAGFTGDIVKVKNIGSGKIVTARVVDNTSVAVTP